MTVEGSAPPGARPPPSNASLPPHSRAGSIAIGAVAIVAIALSIRHRKSPANVVISAPSASASAEVEDPAARLAAAIDALKTIPSSSSWTVGSSAPSANLNELLSALDGVAPSPVGATMPDGRSPPPLPSEAPLTVRLGVVLVRYRGAQLAPESSPSRDVALARADELATIARDDFGKAVRAGDEGSSVDLGVVRRGTLERATEYILFTLPVGWVSPVVDTPRGFWVMKRLR